MNLKNIFLILIVLFAIKNYNLPIFDNGTGRPNYFDLIKQYRQAIDINAFEQAEKTLQTIDKYIIEAEVEKLGYLKKFLEDEGFYPKDQLKALKDSLSEEKERIKGLEQKEKEKIAKGEDVGDIRKQLEQAREQFGKQSDHIGKLMNEHEDLKDEYAKELEEQKKLLQQVDDALKAADKAKKGGEGKVELPHSNLNYGDAANKIAAAKFNKSFPKEYANLIRELEPLNRGIPRHAFPAKLRIMTYNVYGFRDPSKKDSSDKIESMINEVQPDVLIFEEAGKDKAIINRLNKAGYRYQIFGSIDGRDVAGNLILSKVPFAGQSVTEFESNKEIKLRRYRSLLKVELDLSRYGKKNIAIYGTHLAIYTQTGQWDRAGTNDVPDRDIRKKEILEILEKTEKEDQNKNVVIAGDFNDSNRSEAFRALAKTGFTDCFGLAKIAVLFTSLHGHTIDFIVSRLKDLSVAGCYLYFSAASDHIPVIMDVNIA